MYPLDLWIGHHISYTHKFNMFGIKIPLHNILNPVNTAFTFSFDVNIPSFHTTPALRYLNLGFNKALGMVLTFKISNVGLNCLLERKILAPHSSLTPPPPPLPAIAHNTASFLAAFNLEYWSL